MIEPDDDFPSYEGIRRAEEVVLAAPDTIRAGFDPAGSGAVYIQNDNGAWRQIGVTLGPVEFEVEPTADEDTLRFTARSVATIDMQINAETVEVIRRAFGIPEISRPSFFYNPTSAEGRGPMTYLEENEDGDIVERIGSALEDWEHWGDAMRWTAEARPEPAWDDGLDYWQPTGLIQTPGMTALDSRWVSVGAVRDTEGFYQTPPSPSWVSYALERLESRSGMFNPYTMDLEAMLAYAYQRYNAINGARADYGRTPISDETRQRAQRALEEWRGSWPSTARARTCMAGRPCDRLPADHPLPDRSQP